MGPFPLRGNEHESSQFTKEKDLMIALTLIGQLAFVTYWVNVWKG